MIEQEMTYPARKFQELWNILQSNFNDISIKKTRKYGYSVYVCGIQNRWMMVDVNDKEEHGTKYLHIAINVRNGDFTEDEILNETSLPKKVIKGRKRKTCCWQSGDGRAIFINFCDDEDGDYDFSNKGFVKFIEKAYISFKSR